MPARSQPPSRAKRPSRRLRVAVALAVLLAFAGYLVSRHVSGDGKAPRCTVVSGDAGGEVYHFSAEQAVNAATISAVGISRGMPGRAVTIALATALQESGLRNLDHGDRDSLGLFQQRPSQGWGTAEQVMDPTYAAGRFYAHLAKVPGYSRLPLTVAAQRVQHSGFPQAYAKHEPDATLLAAALTGRAAGTLTCQGDSPKEPGDPTKVRKALVHDFGSDVLATAASAVPAEDGTTAGSGTSADDGTTADDGASAGDGATPRNQPPSADSPAASPSASAAPQGAERDMVAVPVRAGDGSAGGDVRQRGWELAHWAVAHSWDLHIARVGYAGREWTPQSGGAWRTADGAGTPGGTAPGQGLDKVLIVTER